MKVMHAILVIISFLYQNLIPTQANQDEKKIVTQTQQPPEAQPQIQTTPSTEQILPQTSQKPPISVVTTQTNKVQQLPIISQTTTEVKPVTSATTSSANTPPITSVPAQTPPTQTQTVASATQMAPIPTTTPTPSPTKSENSEPIPTTLPTKETAIIAQPTPIQIQATTEPSKVSVTTPSPVAITHTQIQSPATTPTTVPTVQKQTISQPIYPSPIASQSAQPAIVTSQTLQGQHQPVIPSLTQKPLISVSTSTPAHTLKPISKTEKPQKSVEQKIEEAKEKTVITSLDTLTAQEQGNWLLKRVWWEQAESTFEKIIDTNEQIIQTQSDYFNKVKENDKKVLHYLQKLGYEQGELDQVLAYLLNQTQEERQTTGDLNIQGRQFLDALVENKKELEQLKTDLQTLINYDVSIDETLSQFVTQINNSRNYEKKSWNDFKEIGRVLNDKKAKVLFYEIDANLKNVQNILNYIKKELSNHLDKLIKNSQNLAENITNKIDKLNNQGLNLKEHFNQLKSLNENRQKSKLEEENKKLKELQKKKNKGWFQSTIDWFKSFF